MAAQAAPVPAPARAVALAAARPGSARAETGFPQDRYLELGHLFAEFLERGARILRPAEGEAPPTTTVVTGASLGLPGRERIFGDDNVQHILDGEQGIDVIPSRYREAMVEKHITRLVKSEAEPHFEAIESPAEVIKLAARGGGFDLEEEFGVPGERVPALDIATKLAMAAGLEALRDAGIPLVMHYRTTSKGTQIPERWMLPETLRDDTGIVFAAAFPGADALVDELNRYHEDRGRHARLELLQALRSRAEELSDGAGVLRDDIQHRIHELEREIEEHAYSFDRRFLFRVLAMGHSQFAEYVGARGPNTHINAACASTTQAFALAEDWIRAGRCRRVVVVAADDVTSDALLPWVGAGFLASGAAATDDVVEEAALPFDRRRHGMILGMGAAGFVIESAEAARERGLRPICEVLSTVTANSAFHGTRLDVDHICDVMEGVVARAERRFGIDRRALARELVFVSHETYTPARGGSASAEVNALRRVFGDDVEQIVVANVKGLTGHPMGVGLEDAVAVKALETGVVPPVPNYREPDPELGLLHLSQGGVYPIRYALRLGAGFGSQISMSLMRWVPTPDGSHPEPDALGYASRLEDERVFAEWFSRVSGDPQAALEVERRTLRVVDRGAASRTAASARVPAAPAPRSEARAAPAAPAAPAVEAAPAAAAEDAIRDRVLGIVSEKTGYPRDMLDPELDLEADLGIDTVKQAETFAAIREAYDIPRDENLQLRDYPTLAHAIQLRAGATPGTWPWSAPVAADHCERPPGGDDECWRSGRGCWRSWRRRRATREDMLDLELDLEADLGIDTVKQAETFAAIREAYDIPRDENLQLRDYPTLAHAIQLRAGATPGTWPSSVAAAAPQRAPREATTSAGDPGAGAGDRCGEDGLPARTCWTWSWTWRRTSGSTR